MRHPYGDKVTDYGDENPLLMDYHGFDAEVYKLKFSSRGDATLSNRVVQLFQNVVPPESPSAPPSHTQFLSIGWYPRSFDEER